MLKLSWHSNAYDAIEKVIFSKYPRICETVIVQLRQKYDCEDDDEWEEKTVLLLQDGDFINPKWVWEYDWWEGQQNVELEAFAPVDLVKLSDEWKVGNEA